MLGGRLLPAAPVASAGKSVMGFRFKQDDKSVEDGFRRIALEQIEAAIAEASDADADPHATIHGVRKRCKALRGLFRMARPGFAQYRKANAAVRDAARILSALRDGEAQIEAFDGLAAAMPDAFESGRFAPVRLELQRRRDDAEARFDSAARLADFAAAMRRLKRQAAGWKLTGTGWSLLGEGAGAIYRRGRKAMNAARKSQRIDDFHDWRKQVKYHWHHSRLLAPAWPGPLRAHVAAADTLAEALGAHRDLDMLIEAVIAEPAAFGEPATAAAFAALARKRQQALDRSAFEQGDRLFAEKPGALARRWGAYWQSWRGGRDEKKPALAA